MSSLFQSVTCRAGCEVVNQVIGLDLLLGRTNIVKAISSFIIHSKKGNVEQRTEL